MSNDELDTQFNRRVRRAFDAATMDSPVDAAMYALLEDSGMTEEDRKKLLPVVLPILAALIHVAERGAELEGTSRSAFVADVRSRRDRRHEEGQD